MDILQIRQQVNTLTHFLTLILNHINTLDTQLRMFKAEELIEELDEESEEEDSQ